MKEKIEQFLETAIDPKTRDIELLKDIYVNDLKKPLPKCQSPVCISKMINEVIKFYSLNFEQKEKAAQARKHTLKDGNHAFAPGGPADHNNDNTSSKQIEHLLKSYPHIKKLLITKQ